MSSHSSSQSSSSSNPTSSSSSGSASTSKSSVEPGSNVSGGRESSGTPSSGSFQSSSGSSSGSAQTVSTMPLVTDQEIVDETDAVSTVKSWGRLLPRNSLLFHVFELHKESHIFGRRLDCDYLFDRAVFANNINLFSSVSNQHFKILKESYGNDPKDYTVFLQDLSRNGTQVNGVTVGQSKTKTIHTGDEISICNKKAFIFIDDHEAEEQQKNYPKELQEKYTISKLLGSGACGEVRLAFDQVTHKPYAIKIISKRKFSVGSRTSTTMFDEVKILRELDHPGIISLEDFFDVDDALYIVLELVSGGELFDRVERLGKFDEDTSKLYFYQMLLAVDFLHSNSIVHRDLKLPDFEACDEALRPFLMSNFLSVFEFHKNKGYKSINQCKRPENVLLATDAPETAIKITDFGLSRIVGENSLMKTLCGTPNYLAPEVLKTHGLGGYSRAVDCWSLGCILYICLGGYPPFSDNVRDMTMYQQVVTGSYSFPDEHWKHISTEAKDLIKRLLTVDASARITVSAALSHPWLQDDEMKAKARELMYPNQAAEANISAENVAQPVADALPAEAPPADEQRANGAPSHVPQPNLAQPYVDQVDMPPPPKIPAIRKLSSSSDEAPSRSKRRRTSTEDAQKEPSSD